MSDNKYKYKGKILVSRPVVLDDVFNRTVVLIVEDDQWGTIGFILNKPTQNKVNNLVNSLDVNWEVYDGGPVQQHKLFYLHSQPNLIDESAEVNHKYYWSGKFKDVEEQIDLENLSNNDIRFFMGYSGWECGQLQAEIDKNAWQVMEDDFDYLAEWDVNLWKRQLKKLGGENLLWINAPKDPLLN